MTWLITKYLLTAAVVVVVSEVARRSDKLGAFIAALPLVTVLALIWLQVESQPEQKLANHAWYTFWYGPPLTRVKLTAGRSIPAGDRSGRDA